MAFLRKKKGSPNWFGVFKDGRFNVEKSMKTHNKHEALRRLARWSVGLEKSFYKRERKIKFSELADKWIATQETPDKKERTLFSYKEKLRVHIKPFFGDRPVNAIKPEDIERFKVEMAKKVITKSKIKREMVNGKEVKVS